MTLVGGGYMADDLTMASKSTRQLKPISFSEMAKQEFALTAMAFFAPVVGTFSVMRGLIQSVGGDAPTPKTPAKKPIQSEREAA